LWHNRSMEQSCKIVDCIGKVWARGWCPKHYRRWQRHNDPTISLYDRERTRGCNIEGCDNPHSAKGLCLSHYGKMRSSLPEVVEQRKLARNKYVQEQYKTDAQFKLASVLRRRITSAIKHEQKAGSAVQDLGCSISKFIDYIAIPP